MLKEYLKKNEPITKPDDRKALLEILNFAQSAINSANNAFIKMLPMIFFAIEYPPEKYIAVPPADGSHFTISYKYPELVFTPTKSKTETTTTQSKESSGTTTETKKPELSIKNYKGYHQAFLLSNNNNSTHSLLYDKLIGLETITKITNNAEAPVNLVSNIMFAIGASGTGKTTRYFGYTGPGGKVEDSKGIVDYIIEKNIGNIDLAYFVVYGRLNKNESNTTATNYNETVIFITKNTSETKIYPFMMVSNTVDTATIGATNDTSYTDFYVKLMSKKICKVSGDAFTEYAKNKNQTTECDSSNTPSEYTNFINLLETNENVWQNIRGTTSGGGTTNIKQLFEDLIFEQKKLRTVMPTINNIESSRGHTCMLLRMKSTTNEYTYFPLFDMAGTENVEKIRDFFKNETIKQAIASVLNNVDYTKDFKFVIGDKPVNSLREIQEQLKAKCPTQQQQQQKPSIICDIQSKDGKNIIDIIECLTKSGCETTALDLINKIEYEGAYINHTIATIIFAVLCVGKTQSAKVTEKGDQFDNILREVQQKMIESKLCNNKEYANSVETKIKATEKTTGEEKEKEVQCGSTMYLYDKDISYEQILNKSCLWAQIIFGFLYWNKETLTSSQKFFKNYTSDKKYDDTDYLQDFDQSANIIINDSISSKYLN